MMDLSRRRFLSGVLSVAATSVIAGSGLARAMPRIIADGVHDDGPGLNALFDGRPVDIVNDAVRIIRGDGIFLAKGTFRACERLVISRPDTWLIGNGFIFDIRDELDGYAITVLGRRVALFDTRIVYQRSTRLQGSLFAPNDAVCAGFVCYHSDGRNVVDLQSAMFDGPAR